MGRPISKNSLRQRILALEVGASLTFPVERIEYVTSMMYRVGKITGRRYSRLTVGKRVKVTRIE